MALWPYIWVSGFMNNLTSGPYFTPFITGFWANHLLNNLTHPPAAILNFRNFLSFSYPNSSPPTFNSTPSQTFGSISNTCTGHGFLLDDRICYILFEWSQMLQWDWNINLHIAAEFYGKCGQIYNNSMDAMGLNDAFCWSVKQVGQLGWFFFSWTHLFHPRLWRRNHFCFFDLSKDPIIAGHPSDELSIPHRIHVWYYIYLHCMPNVGKYNTVHGSYGYQFQYIKESILGVVWE